MFWTRAYNGTSLVDLIDGTGLSRGSLYKAFGDKHGLFLAALERYTLRRLAQISSGVEGLHGCMLVAAATEMLPHDADVAPCVSAMFDRMHNAYAAAIARSQEAARSRAATTRKHWHA